jgi:hypothetical protein
MWPLVKDFISGKVIAALSSQAPPALAASSCLRPVPSTQFHLLFSHCCAQAASSDVYDRRGALAVLRSTAEGLAEAMRSNAEGLMRCALQGLADHDPRVVNEGPCLSHMF